MDNNIPEDRGPVGDHPKTVMAKKNSKDITFIAMVIRLLNTTLIFGADLNSCSLRISVGRGCCFESVFMVERGASDTFIIYRRPFRRACLKGFGPLGLSIISKAATRAREWRISTSTRLVHADRTYDDMKCGANQSNSNQDSSKSSIRRRHAIAKQLSRDIDCEMKVDMEISEDRETEVDCRRTSQCVR